MNQETWELKRKIWKGKQLSTSSSDKVDSQTETNAPETTLSNVVDSGEHLPVSEQN